MAGLNREEWNAAYFLGLEEITCSDLQCDFDGQIEAGTRCLRGAGYQFRGRLSGAGRWSHEPTAHERGCRELADGTFDAIGRAREALHWLGCHVPGLDTGWLRRILTCYDQAHTGPAPV